MTERADLLVIGGGIVGLATAFSYARAEPGARVVVLEKETGVARHQTGHNSGVLHSGIYYRPGSLKAVNCRAGKRLMEAFCAEEGIPFEICGKVIVAVDASELARLDALFERGRQNGVDCEMIGPERLRELEPHVAGVRAIHVKEAGIVNYVRVCERLAQRLRESGGEVRLGARVDRLRPDGGRVRVVSAAGEFDASRVVNCAGLYSDKVTALGGVRPPVKIVPFRGEYFEVREGARHLCRNLIYPVPDPAFPFLGVHFTRMIGGGVECGPNAVFAFAREGYRKSDVDWVELAETLAYPGFWRMFARHWRMGCAEMWRSFSRAAFVAALRRLVPDIRDADVRPAPAGVRAQALAPDGRLLDDFSVETAGRIINVCNAPSPAATAALNIGKTLAEEAKRIA